MQKAHRTQLGDNAVRVTIALLLNPSSQKLHVIIMIDGEELRHKLSGYRCLISFLFSVLFILTFARHMLLTSWRRAKAVPRVRLVCYNLNLICLQQVWKLVFVLKSFGCCVICFSSRSNQFKDRFINRVSSCRLQRWKTRIITRRWLCLFVQKMFFASQDNCRCHLRL